MKALHQHLFRREVNVVIDVDLARFFDTIDHERLRERVAAKVAVPRFLRYLTRLFKAGVLAQGELRASDEGGAEGQSLQPGAGERVRPPCD